MTTAAVVLTQAATADALAAACAMSSAAVDVVPTDIGAVAVCRALEAGEPERVAMALSRLLASTPVVLVLHRDGGLKAYRWEAGREVEELAAGLVLDGAPDVIERVLLGQAQATDQPGVVSSVGMSRWRAARTLMTLSRRRSRGAGA